MVKAIGFRLIDRGFKSWPSHIYLFVFSKRNKKLNRNVMNWRGRILPTVQQKSTNFSIEFNESDKRERSQQKAWRTPEEDQRHLVSPVEIHDEFLKMANTICFFSIGIILGADGYWEVGVKNPSIKNNVFYGCSLRWVPFKEARFDGPRVLLHLPHLIHTL